MHDRKPARPPQRGAVVAVSTVAAVLVEASRAVGAGGRLVAVATLPQVVNNIRDWLIGLLAGLATLFMTVGGIRYVISGGDPSEVERAKTALRSAAIGYGLAMLAPVLVAVLKGLVGA